LAVAIVHLVASRYLLNLPRRREATDALFGHDAESSLTGKPQKRCANDLIAMM
jgi:hypothetical protein